MSLYGELDPIAGHSMQFTFKGKREHIAISQDKPTCQI